jgi:hypothetical protein
MQYANLSAQKEANTDTLNMVTAVREKLEK